MRLLYRVLWISYCVVHPIVQLFARPTTALAIAVYRISAPILSRFAGVILISVVAGACFLVWLHALLFAYVDTTILASAGAAGVDVLSPFSYTDPATWGLTPVMIGSLIEAGGGMAASMAGIAQYLL